MAKPIITPEYRRMMADINKNNYEVSFDCLSGEHGKCTWSIGICPCKCHTETK